MSNTIRTAGGPYGVVHRTALRCLPAGDMTARSVYSLLMTYAHDGACWPKQETLAEELGCSAATIRRALAVVEEAGLLRRQPRLVNGRKVGNTYTVGPDICDEEPADMTADGTRTDARSGDATERAPTRATERAPTRDPRARDRLIAEQLSTEQLTARSENLPGFDETDLTRVVFDAWCQSTGRKRAVLDEKRRRVIRHALGLYSIDDVLDAVRGWTRSPHHRGENDGGTVYNDLALLLRDCEHIERFRDLFREPPRARPVNGNGAQTRAERNRSLIHKHYEEAMNGDSR